MKNIPNILTLIGLFLGASAVLFAYQEAYLLAFLLCFFGMLCDLFDGFLARKYHLETKLGKYLDSISDIFLYLLFPGILWIKNSQPAVVVIILVFAGAFRLIRFSLKGYKEKEKQLYYNGMPVFYLQALLPLTLLLPLPQKMTTLFIAISSVLMVSTIPFKKPSLKTYIILLALYLLTAGIFIWR